MKILYVAIFLRIKWLIDILKALDHHHFMNVPLRIKRLVSLCIYLLLINLPVISEITIQSTREEYDWLIEIHNNSDSVFEAMIISGNALYRPESGEISLSPGDSTVLKMRNMDHSKDTPVQVLVRLISDHNENPGMLSLGEPAKEVHPIVNLSPGGIALEYYYTPTCKSCREFLEVEIPRLEEKLHLEINLTNYDITTSEGLILMNRRLSELESSEKKLPMLIKGNVILAGDVDIKENLEKLILQVSSGEIPSEGTENSNKNTGNLKLTLLPILLAGLLDGINPCAFSTLIFLLSWLTLAGRNKKEIMITGILFTSAVFITYYTVGLGAFTALRSSKSLPVASAMLKYAMAALMLVLAGLHLSDYKKVRQGRANEMTLQLSKERKKKIHSLIRGKARKAGLFAGSLVLGIVVTIYELGCTGQVYLPTLMYMVRIEKALSSYILLGIYNLGFIIPLIIVFTAAWKGISSEKLATWFGKNLSLVKLVSAGFFLMMALLLLIF
jgi:cytochrome c biogenesis protein CcdA